MLTLKTYAHSMQDEETDLSFADFSAPSAPKRPYTAPLLNDDPTNENAPDLTGRGRSLDLEHETGLAGGLRPLALAERSSAANRRPPRWQGDAGLDFIEVFRLERSYRIVSVNSGGKLEEADHVGPARGNQSGM
jgi:hypothetical protein